jgi:phosphoserine aminotransferase
MAPYNLMKEGGKAAYLDTGTWASGAIKEAKFLRDSCCGSSKEQNYNHIPKATPSLLMLIIFTVTSNNTNFGTQIGKLPPLHANCLRYEF